jgi:hypothetical protein
METVDDLTTLCNRCHAVYETWKERERLMAG